MMMDKNLDTLARTLYGEAEAGNESDARAIAAVVMNRVKYPNWPNSAAAVCLQPWQFSCWNANDPGRARVMAAQGKWFESCIAIAREALDGKLFDPTRTSTHYYATYVKKPKWAKGKTPVYEVRHKGGHAHVFYNDIDTRPPVTAAQALEQQRPIASTSTVKIATGGSVASGATAFLSENADVIGVAAPVASALAQYSGWVVFAIAFMFFGWHVYNRIQDRKAGKV